MGQEKKDVLTISQIQQIQSLAAALRYGSITLIFQDGVLVQIDKSEKIRVTKIKLTGRPETCIQG